MSYQNLFNCYINKQTNTIEFFNFYIRKKKIAFYKQQIKEEEEHYLDDDEI